MTAFTGFFAGFLATWGYSGKLRPGPGTWGSLAGLPFAWGLLNWGGKDWLALAAVAVLLLGCWAADRHMAATGQNDDPAEVVIDEVAGLWIACLGAPDNHPAWLLAAFVAFRLFDIWKPGPVGWADRRLKGAVGVMADDVIAGGMAAALLLLAPWLWGVLS